MTPQMKDCLVLAGKLQEETIKMIETTSIAMVRLVGESGRQALRLATLELELAAAKDDAAQLRRWLDSNTTFYNTDESSAPVLASVSKRIWYHATDDTDSFPFSAVAARA